MQQRKRPATSSPVHGLRIRGGPFLGATAGFAGAMLLPSLTGRSTECPQALSIQKVRQTWSRGMKPFGIRSVVANCVATYRRRRS